MVEDSRHTNAEIWGAINTQGREISQVKADVAGLAAEVSAGFRSIGSQIQEMANKVNRPPQTRGWLAFSITLAGALAAIGVMYMNPVVDRQDRIEARQIEIIQELSYEKGYREGVKANETR